MSKSQTWLKASVASIMSRKRYEMQWQVMLTILAQPALSDEGASAKEQAVTDIMEALSDGEEEPMNDEDSLALLRMAGRKPIRNVKNGSN